MCIHNYAKKYEQTKKRLAKAKISERNKELILEMDNSLILDGISKPRLMKYIEVLKIVAHKLGKDFDVVTEQDLKRVVSEIQQADYSPWTKQTYKVILRRFYKWLTKTEDGYPLIVKWISIKMSRSEQKLPSEGDLLNEADVKKLMGAADHAFHTY